MLSLTPGLGVAPRHRCVIISWYVRMPRRTTNVAACAERGAMGPAAMNMPNTVKERSSRMTEKERVIILIPFRLGNSRHWFKVTTCCVNIDRPSLLVSALPVEVIEEPGAPHLDRTRERAFPPPQPAAREEAGHVVAESVAG